MKPIVNYLRFFFLTIFCFSCSFVAFGTTTDAIVAENEKIIRTNWPAEYMGTTYIFHNDSWPSIDPVPCNICPPVEPSWPTKPRGVKTPCIRRNTDGNIKIGLNFAVSRTEFNALTPQDEIYLRYTIGTTTDEMATFEMNNNSTSPNSTITFSKLLSIDLSHLSLFQSFQYTIELVKKTANNTFIPYPIDDHPNLFVEYDYRQTYLEYPIYNNNKTILGGVKQLCRVEINPLLSNDSNARISVKEQSNTTTPQSTQNLELQAYPNPFTNQLHLKGQIPENTTIEIFDIQGKVIYYEKLTNFASDSPKMIDTSSFPIGMYYCKIKNATSSQTIKVVKQ